MTTIPRLPIAYSRRPTRVVRIGSVPVGGCEPIRVQSMTTTDTGDVEATALQTLALAEAGCEIVRWTVPNMADAAAPQLRLDRVCSRVGRLRGGAGHLPEELREGVQLGRLDAVVNVHALHAKRKEILNDLSD